jgi:hypothetical protein
MGWQRQVKYSLRNKNKFSDCNARATIIFASFRLMKKPLMWCSLSIGSRSRGWTGFGTKTVQSKASHRGPRPCRGSRKFGAEIYEEVSRCDCLYEDLGITELRSRDADSCLNMLSKQLRCSLMASTRAIFFYFNPRIRSCRNCRSGSCWVSARAFS